MAIVIKKAVKYGAKLRMALYGPSGSGKTYTSLKVAFELAGDKKVCVIDTERGSASKYADVLPPFDVIELDSFHPNGYIEAIKAVIQAKEYGVLVIDSASHEWEGSRGALELAGRDFTNWASVTPLHNKFIDAMLVADIHVIATMRAKEEHVMEKEEGKKAVIRKMGMEPIQRKGMQYEFDIVCSLNMDNLLTVEKTRCSSLKDQAFRPGNEQAFTEIVQAWLDGAPAPSETRQDASHTGNGHQPQSSATVEAKATPAASGSDLVGKERVVSLYNYAYKLGLFATLQEWQHFKTELLGRMVPDEQVTVAQFEEIKEELARRKEQATASGK